ncbi:hypothetical protein LEMLEM_LOCUS4320 [Lemmus lemmus]
MNVLLLVHPVVAQSFLLPKHHKYWTTSETRPRCSAAIQNQVILQLGREFQEAESRGFLGKTIALAACGQCCVLLPPRS